MTCQETVEVLLDYLDATLSVDAVRELEAHLQRCPPCQAYLNTYKKTAELTSRAGRVDMPEEMKRHLREFLVAQLGRQGS